MRTKIAKRAVGALRPGETITDIEVKGFRARCLPSGSVAYEFRYRKRNGRRAFVPLGIHGSITPDQARNLAKKRAGEVADDRDPAAERAAQRATTTNTVNAVLDSFLARYVRAQGLRSADEIERALKVYVRPKLGNKSIYDVQRRDIVELLDQVEDNGAPVQADRVLAHLRKAFNWWATRDEKFNSPIVQGMSRTKPAERARKRVLDDQEIRDLWAALDVLDKAPACFAPFVRVLLLTAQRLRMVSDMSWQEIDGTDWIIPPARNKGKTEQVVPLTDTVAKLLSTKRTTGYVFSSDAGKTSFKGFSKSKGALDAKLAEIRKATGRKAMAPWVFHDLRRTARSLMARAGVTSDIAERVLGHVIGGVRGVYDRHQYRDEKLAALEKLGALVERILLPPGAKVVSFPKSARRSRKAS